MTTGATGVGAAVTGVTTGADSVGAGVPGVKTGAEVGEGVSSRKSVMV